MANSIAAIQTPYNGYRFRSRLEARWAVFFDTLGVEWDYENEGYQLPSGWYLPDFWLPRAKVFLEVKPYNWSHSDYKLDQAALQAVNKTREMKSGGMDLLIVAGRPWPHEYHIYQEGIDGLIVPSQFGRPRKCCGLSVIDCAYTSEDCDYAAHLGKCTTFYHTDGCNTDKCTDSLPIPIDIEFYEAARSARFEHGESGPVWNKTMPF